MLATQVILCVTLIGNAVLFTAALKERSSLIRSVFALYVVLIFGWTFTIFLNLFFSSLSIEEWVFATAGGMLTAQLWFVKLFPDGTPPSRPFKYWSLALGCVFTLSSFYPGALFTAIVVHPEGYTTLNSGPLSIAYSLFALIYACAPTVVLFRKYRRERDGEKRWLLRQLMIGFSIFMVVAVLTNSILPVFFRIYSFNAIGPSLSLIFASFAFYISWKHEFLDIRRAVLRGAIYSFVIGIVMIADIVLLAAAEQYLESIQLFTWIHADDVVDPLTAMLVTAVGIATAPLVERYFQRVTHRLFFKDRYNYALALESLSEVITESVDFDLLVQRIRENLARILPAEFVDVLLYDGQTRTNPRTSHAQSIVSRELLFEPIWIDNVEIGCIVVGQKSSGDKYRREDQRLLRTFALQASTALARAQLFMRVRKHADELEQKVTERTRQLQEAHERETHMVLDIAHGLQTPLAVFRTKLDTLHSSDVRMTDIGTLERPLEDLSRFISELLTLTQLEHAQEFHFEQCCLSELIKDISDEVEIIASTRSIGIKRDIAPDITVRADIRELRCAIMNLATNAVRYMRLEDPRIITFHLLQEGQYARFSLQDTGIGIPPEDVPHIFDRFYRVRHSEKSGNGLGLAISKKVIERHDGSIEVESTLGTGTAITIALPLQ